MDEGKKSGFVQTKKEKGTSCDQEWKASGSSPLETPENRCALGRGLETQAQMLEAANANLEDGHKCVPCV